MRKLIALLLLSLYTLAAPAQSAAGRIRFERLTTTDGLPENSVPVMLQDHLGFMWLGTQNGLVRYDGNKMSNFQYQPGNPNSLKGKHIRALREDSNGDIWIGAESLYRFERATQRFIEYADSNRFSKAENSYIVFIHLDKQGNVWTITDGTNGAHILQRYNVATQSWSSFQQDKSGFDGNRVYADYMNYGFAEDNRGVIWVSSTGDSANTLFSFDAGKGSFVRFNPSAQAGALPDFKKPTSLLSDKNGGLYILSEEAKGVLLLNTSSGQIKQLKNEPGNSNSLMCDTVINIYQDHSGSVWITSLKGIDRYEPGSNTFAHYPAEEDKPASPFEGDAWLQCEAPNGNLWFYVYGIGLSCYERKTDKFMRYAQDTRKEDGLPPNQIYCCFADRDGLLWVGTQAAGLYKESRLIKFKLIAHSAPDSTVVQDATVYTIYEAPSQPGIMWFGTKSGLDRWDKQTGVYTHYRHEKFNNNSLSEGIVLAIAEDDKGRFWVGTENGLNLMDRSDGSFSHFIHNPADAGSLINSNISFLKPTSDGKLWIGTAAGLDVFDVEHEVFTHYVKADSAYSPAVYKLINEYTNGRLLAAILHPGNEVDRTAAFNLTQPTDLLVAGMGEISAQKSDYGWIEDAEGKRVWEMDEANTLSDGGANARIRASIIHLNAGSYRLRYKSDDIYSYNNWAGPPPYHPELWGLQLAKVSDEEIQKFKQEASKRYSNGLGDNTIFWITEDSDKIIRIGSASGGVTKFDPASGKFTSYTNLFEGPFCTSGYMAKESNTSNIWVGDYEEGLLLLDANGKVIKRFNIFNGMPSNSVQGIQRDASGILWVMTDNGLCRFDPATEKIQIYNQRHGLLNRGFRSAAFFSAADGEIYIGGTKGVYAFHPRQIKTDTTLAPVILTDFFIAGKPATLGPEGQMPVHITVAKNITLPHEQNDVTFQFTSLLYNQGSESRFAYKLSPNDKDWIQAGGVRQARYTNLSPGDYTFTVKAANSDGVWNEEGASIRLTILPPWWQTWWFRSLVVLFVIACIAYYIQWRERSLKKEQKVLESKVEERTAEVVAEKKEVEKQKERSEELLLNILPAEVAEELKEKGTAAARHFDDVSVLFTDFKGFTTISEKLSPQQLVDELHACFSAFDKIIATHNIEKIKTVGDAYLAVSGLPLANPKHAQDMVKAAIEIRGFMQRRKLATLNSALETFDVRIGIHSGSVVAGIVGVKKFAYDIWGDTVNTAARMEQNSEAGKINISQTTYDLVREKFNCQYRGEIEAKNKGKLKMYFVE